MMSNASPSNELAHKKASQRVTPTRPTAARNGALIEAQPFLKWVGGKAQLLEQFEPFFPASIQSYCEPFLGGGAVYFHLKARFPKMRAALRDNNKELINCYQVVRDSVHDLMSRLDQHLQEFRAQGAPFYYFMRNQHKLGGAIERASRMIFLNKTCYNGLWRVNGRGLFNVPIGSYRPEKVALYDPSNLLAASRALQDADLSVLDFRQTLAAAAAGDFIYVDPPYYPLSPTANFTSYTKEEFGKAEQKELAKSCSKAVERGAQLMLSNSDTPLTRQLYGAFNLKTVQARRAVNCHGAKRGRVSELIVLSYEPAASTRTR
jgi:DNA adenine methylase